MILRPFSALNVLTKLNNTPYLPTLIFGSMKQEPHIYFIKAFYVDQCSININYMNIVLLIVNEREHSFFVCCSCFFFFFCCLFVFLKFVGLSKRKYLYILNSDYNENDAGRWSLTGGKHELVEVCYNGNFEIVTKVTRNRSQ